MLGDHLSLSLSLSRCFCLFLHIVMGRGCKLHFLKKWGRPFQLVVEQMVGYHLSFSISTLISLALFLTFFLVIFLSRFCSLFVALSLLDNLDSSCCYCVVVVLNDVGMFCLHFCNTCISNESLPLFCVLGSTALIALATPVSLHVA